MWIGTSMHFELRLLAVLFLFTGFFQGPQSFGDDAKLNYYSTKEVLAGPPRNPRQKYVVTMKSIPEIAGEVRAVQIGNAVVDSGCIRYFCTLTMLEELVLQEVNIGDGELALLLASTDCRYINVMGTSITNASIPIIASEVSLKKVFLGNTAIDHEGIRELKRLRPDLEVFSDD